MCACIREATWSPWCLLKHALLSSTCWEEIINKEAGSRCCQWETGWEGVTSRISSRRSGSITERLSHEYSQHCLCIWGCAETRVCCSLSLLNCRFQPEGLLLCATKKTYTFPLTPYIRSGPCRLLANKLMELSVSAASHLIWLECRWAVDKLLFARRFTQR